MMNPLDRPDESQNQDEGVIRELVRLADTDTTAPKPENLREGWETETALNQVERRIGYNERQWDKYERICERAARLTQPPDAATLFRIGQLNGARRTPHPDWNIVAQLLRETANDIARLEAGTRKTRLQELHAYHHGITARYTGDYATAASYQRGVAERSETRNDSVGSAISRLSEQVDLFNHALVEDRDTRQLLTAFEEAAKHVVETCTDDQNPSQTQWHYFSAPVHVLEAHIWSKQPIDSEREMRWLNILTREFADKAPRQFENLQPTLMAIQAGLAMLKGDRDEALRLAREVETTHAAQAMPNARATAVLVMNAFGEDQQYSEPEALASACGYMHQVMALIKRNRGR